MYSDSIVLTILVTLVLLGVLVAVHEAGHFFVARWCGVKVLRFSIGFGKAIWRKVGKDGTEYVIALLPLGGYVRMLDSRMDEVAENQISVAFDQQNVYRRIAIVAAGPLINLIFAALIYTGIHYTGVSQLVPVIAQPVVGSAADTAGMEISQRILSIDGKPVNSWPDVHWQLVDRAGETGTVIVQSQALDSVVLQTQAQAFENQSSKIQTEQHSWLPTMGTPKDYYLSIDQWLLEDTDTSPALQIGWQPWQPTMPVYIGHLADKGAAQIAGLQVDDLIISINQQPTPDFTSFVEKVQMLPEQTVIIEFERADQFYQRPITIQSRTTEQGNIVGVIGIGLRPLAWPQSLIQNTDLNVWQSMNNGLAQTYQMVSLTLGFIKRIFVGQIPVEHLSGPISIAQIAASTASTGWITFFSFMAYLSVSLGVLNLLPVPMLDGGHLLYYFIELCTGKTVPDRIQSIGFRIGLVFIFVVMFIAIINDVSRL